MVLTCLGMHAGIPMKDLLVGCMVGLIQDTPLLDLNLMEEQGGRGPQLFTAMHCSLDKACARLASHMLCLQCTLTHSA